MHQFLSGTLVLKLSTVEAQVRLQLRAMGGVPGVQVYCCNIHFIGGEGYQINTSQTVACFKPDHTPEDMPRKLSICTWTLVPEFPEVLIVPDALQDIRSDCASCGACQATDHHHGI